MPPNAFPPRRHWSQPLTLDAHWPRATKKLFQVAGKKKKHAKKNQGLTLGDYKMRLIIALAAAMACVPRAPHGRARTTAHCRGPPIILTGAQLLHRTATYTRPSRRLAFQHPELPQPETRRPIVAAGYVTQPPDFTFNLSGHGLPIALVISTVSDCDSILLINTGTATWYYDDDDNPSSVLDARINLTRPTNGWLDVWVGTHDGQYCDAVLSMETFYR